MRSTSEQAEIIGQRVQILKERRRRRRTVLITGLCSAACLGLIVWTALLLPGLAARQGVPAGQNPGAAAGVFAAGSSSGYVFIGLMAFVLGCGVTILCIRLHRQDGEDPHGRNH